MTIPETKQLPTKRSSFILNSDSISKFFIANWLNVVVLLFALGASAAATAVSYMYANDSINSLNIQLRGNVLDNIQNQIGAYLEKNTAIIPVAKSFLADRTIDTGVVANPDFKKAAKYMGHFYFATQAATQSSLFYMDTFGNNLGWGKLSGLDAILFLWDGYGTNFYLPVDGTIGNLSQPVYHSDDKSTFPPLAIVKQTLQPYWGDPYFLALGNGEYSMLLPYVEPAFFDDTGDFLGLVGSNVAVDGWETVLAGYQIGKTGKVFIMSTAGLLLADSNTGVQYKVIASDGVIAQVELPKATDNSDPMMAAAAKYLVDTYGAVANIPDSQQLLEFEMDGTTILLLCDYIKKDSLKLVVVISVPKSDFTGDIDKSRVLAIGLTVAASVLGALNYMPWAYFYRWFRHTVLRKNDNKVISMTVQHRPNTPRGFMA